MNFTSLSINLSVPFIHESFIFWLNLTDFCNLVPMVVSEPLFQSSSQKTTLVQGVVSDGEFDFIAMSVSGVEDNIFCISSRYYYFNQANSFLNVCCEKRRWLVVCSRDKRSMDDI